MLSLTEILEYSLYREGQVLIPITAFKYDMNKLETLYYNVVRQAERYVPRSEDVFMYVTKHGVHLPDVYAIKSLGFTGNATNQLIPPIIRPTRYRYWHWDKNTHILQSQISAHYLVKCLKYYTFRKLHYLDELGMPMYDQAEFTGKLIAEPEVTSLRIRSGCKTAVFTELEACCENASSSLVVCQGDLGTARYDTETRMVTLLLDEPVCEPIVAEYLTKYKGFQELEIGTSNLITDWFAAELFAGLGSLLAVTQIEQSPIKWDAPNLIEYGRNLRQQVFERRGSQMNFYEWLP